MSDFTSALRTRSVSPAKKAGTPASSQKKGTPAAAYRELSYMDKEIIQGLTEKEVEIDHLRTNVIALNQKLDSLKDVEGDAQKRQGLLEQSEAAREKLQKQLHECSLSILEEEKKNAAFQKELIEDKRRVSEEALAQKAQMQAVIDDLNAQLRAKEDNIDSLRSTLSTRELAINELQQVELEQRQTILRLEQELAIKKDVEEQLQAANELIEKLTSEKKKLQKDLLTASDYIIEEEEKCYKSNQTSLELLRQLKDAEGEIETLRNYIVQLKQRMSVYIPAKDDAVDKKLAEFINNYPERNKLKIMFMRESEGIYQFGSKRVFCRVEKDKIIIRVGGGYLSIEEFLDIYTPLELDKIERKDPMRKFSERMAVQKTLVGREVRESSPIRGASPEQRRPSSPMKSPTRSPAKSPSKRR